eukprot:gene42189-51520_t
MSDTDDVRVETVVGRIISCAPVLLESSEFVAITMGNKVKIVGVSDGMVKGVYLGHNDNSVVKVLVNDKITARLKKRHTSLTTTAISLAQNGELHIWDTVSCQTLYVFKIDKDCVDVHILVVDDHYENLWDAVKVFVTRRSERKTYDLHEFSLASGSLQASVVVSVQRPQLLAVFALPPQADAPLLRHAVGLVSASRASKGSRVTFTLLPEEGAASGRG